MQNKKILIFSHEFPPFGGGAGIVAYQYCKKLQKRGNEVTLLTRKNKFLNELKNINIIQVVHIPKLWFIPYYFKLKSINLKQFDTIILNDIASGFIAGKYFDNETLSKCIPILHGSEPENIYNCPSIFFKLMRFEYYYNNMLQNSNKIIAVSNYMKEKFLEETNFKDERKIEVVYSGLSDDFLIEKEVNCKDIISDYKDKEIILTVSRIEKQKGFLDMYEIFKRLIKKDDSFIWIIIGDGKFKKEFENIVKQDNLEKKVIFKGKIPRNELYKYYKCADVFWLLSKYKESFGLVYLEAQTYGCPAIGYNKYGVKEAICDGKTGFLVDNADECLDIFLGKKYKKLKKIDFINFIKALNYA